jgi:hypothetical protein
MKITEKPETPGGTDASGIADRKPQKRFSEVLEEKKETIDGATIVAPTFRPPQPFLPVLDDAPICSSPVVATQTPEAILAALVQEIVVVTAPGNHASVDIQFDSRTLEGLHVQVRKTSDSVEVRFSTASEAVSRLLTANVDALTQALAQQGFAAPAVSVQHAPAITFSNAESGRSDTDSGSQRRRDQGRGQRRR